MNHCGPISVAVLILPGEMGTMPNHSSRQSLRLGANPRLTLLIELRVFTVGTDVKWNPGGLGME